jgi:hypothetical protein
MFGDDPILLETAAMYVRHYQRYDNVFRSPWVDETIDEDCDKHPLESTRIDSGGLKSPEATPLCTDEES